MMPDDVTVSVPTDYPCATGHAPGMLGFLYNSLLIQYNVGIIR